MKKTEKLFVLALKLVCVFGIICATAFQNSYASLSSSNFILSPGNIVESDINQYSSDNYILSSQITTVGVTASSASFQTLPSLLAATTSCGNGIKETNENCDGSDFGGATCSDYGYNSGSLTCSSACSIDSSGCFNQNLRGGGGSGGGGSTIVSPTQESEEEAEQDLSFGENSLEEYLEKLIEKMQVKETEENDPWSELEEKEKEEFTKIILPSAEEEIVKENAEEKIEELHKSAEEEIIKTIDQTPVFFGELTSNKEYQAVVLDTEGNLIETQTIFTDEHGRFIYEIQTPLSGGSAGSLKITDPSGKEAVGTSYSFEITEKKESYPKVKLISFGDKDLSTDDVKKPQEESREMSGEPLDLGVIEIKKGRSIKGYAVPFAEIVAYFQSEIVVVKTTADKNGYFEIKIPTELKHGEHSVTISQKFSDGIVSENLSYHFELDNGDNQINWPKVIMYLIVVLSLVLINFSYYVFKLEIKKRNINKSE